MVKKTGDICFSLFTGHVEFLAQRLGNLISGGAIEQRTENRPRRFITRGDGAIAVVNQHPGITILTNFQTWV